jgi:hypothetical protein
MSPRARSPVQPGVGANFVLYRLEQDGPLWRYNPTLGAKLFNLVFSLAGYAALLLGVVQLVRVPPIGLVALVIGVLFLWISRYLSARIATGPVFDTMVRRIELFERIADTFSFSPMALKQRLRFDQVRELEMLTKHIQRLDRAGYDNHELNLVLDDGTRVNLISHPDTAQIARDAQTLAGIIGVPIRDDRRGRQA